MKKNNLEEFFSIIHDTTDIRDFVEKCNDVDKLKAVLFKIIDNVERLCFEAL